MHIASLNVPIDRVRLTPSLRCHCGHFTEKQCFESLKWFGFGQEKVMAGAPWERELCA